jgi:glycerophosphoryl diester phosphodiesterase
MEALFDLPPWEEFLKEADALDGIPSLHELTEITKDGELISLHDPTLDRVSDGHGKIYEHTFEELTGLDFGGKFSEAYRGLRVLKFEEVLQKFACHVVMNIHIKNITADAPYDPALMRKIIALIDKYDCRKHVYFMSENDNILRLAQEMAPDIVRVVGFDGDPGNMVDRALRYDCKKIQLFKPYFDQALIDRAHENGILCNVFYADEPEEACRYLAMGIDAILTNDFGRVNAAVQAYKAAHAR